MPQTMKQIQQSSGRALQERAPGSSLIFLLHIIVTKECKLDHINGTPTCSCDRFE